METIIMLCDKRNIDMESKLHQRNKHINGYKFDELTNSNPQLKPFVKTNPNGQFTIDFSNQKAVKELNKALLLSYYNVEYWDLPEGHLCPPIPGRVDYIHYLADLLETKSSDQIKGLDIGTGANLIYPILGHAEYGWKFVGSEINSESIASAKHILSQNPNLSACIKVRRQKNKNKILDKLIQSQERFDFTICNPPFHSSEEEALKSNQIKSKKLGVKTQLNFGGVHSELWCNGGEKAFIEQFLNESVKFQSKVLWFTCLVSKKSNLELLRFKFEGNKHIKDFKIVNMTQGQKQSRFIAWTFLTPGQIKEWKKRW